MSLTTELEECRSEDGSTQYAITVEPKHGHVYIETQPLKQEHVCYWESPTTVERFTQLLDGFNLPPSAPTLVYLESDYGGIVPAEYELRELMSGDIPLPEHPLLVRVWLTEDGTGASVSYSVTSETIEMGASAGMEIGSVLGKIMVSLPYGHDTALIRTWLEQTHPTAGDIDPAPFRQSEDPALVRDAYMDALEQFVADDMS